MQSLWDTLLDTRIRLQKAVVAANRLPPVSLSTSGAFFVHLSFKPSSMNSFLQAPECRNALDRILNETNLLIDVMDDLQEVSEAFGLSITHQLIFLQDLLTTNNIVTPPPKKRRKLDSTAELSGALIEATDDAAALEETYVTLCLFVYTCVD